MTNKIIGLNQKEISNISGGIVGELLVVGALFGAYSISKTWQNGSCKNWKENEWSSERSCYLTNAAEDAVYLGMLIPIAAAWFHNQGVDHHHKQ